MRDDALSWCGAGAASGSSIRHGITLDREGVYSVLRRQRFLDIVFLFLDPIMSTKHLSVYSAPGEKKTIILSFKI